MSKKKTYYFRKIRQETCFGNKSLDTPSDFFICNLAAPLSTLGHYQGDSITYSILCVQPEDHQ